LSKVNINIDKELTWFIDFLEGEDEEVLENAKKLLLYELGIRAGQLTPHATIYKVLKSDLT